MRKKTTPQKTAKSKTLTGTYDYIKTHKLKKAADVHARKIRARGGTVSRKKTKSGYELKYSF
ncbi:MAG: hypothetical protein AB7U05_08945 [Mangrovibacterium sp.]